MDLAEKANYLRPKAKPGEQNKTRLYRFCEEKLDGHRLCVIYGTSGGFSAFGRKPEINLWPQVSKACPEIADNLSHQKRNILIDGELIIDDGEPFKSPEITSALAGMSDRKLVWRPFHIIGSSKPYRMQRLFLSEHGFKVTKLLPQFSALKQHAKPVNYHWHEIHEYIVNNDIEGVVLKLTAGGGWFKVKRLHTCDLIIRDVEEGDGANRGKCGVFVLSTYDGTIVGRCKILDEELRLPIEDKREHIGRVVEVAFDSLTKYKKIRFARMLRFRDDKPEDECDGKDIYA